MKIPKIDKTETGNDNNVYMDLSDVKEFHYQFMDYDDEKELTKYIKYLEKIIRKSIEYRNYITYLKEEENLTSCKFLRNIDISDTKKVGLEFHHYPFTLYDITNIVLNKMTNDYSNKVNSFDVAKEVMLLHYRNKVGLIPLTTTVHELAHSGEIFINLNLVYGNYEQFIEEYHDYIDSDLMDNFNLLKNLSQSNNSDKNNKFILEKKYTNIVMNEREIEELLIKSSEMKVS